MRVISHEKGIDLKLSCLKVGEFIFFKSGSMAHKKGMATNQDLGKEVAGFVFDRDGLMVYVKMEDAIDWEIDWEKTIDVNYQELKRRESEKFWAVINKSKEAIKKDKDMKFTSCQNVDCNKEYDFNDLIDVAVQASKDGLLEINKLDRDFITANIPGNSDCIFLTGYRDKPKNFKSDISDIKSLYTETFVIKDLSFPELKVGAIFTQNGIKTILNEDRIKVISNTPFFLLEGATVTQKRSINE